MEKKYRTKPEGNMLRIIAIKDFPTVKKGDIGGLIEKESNLSQEGDCWVYGDAKVWEKVEVSGKVKISGSTKIGGTLRVWGENLELSGDGEIREPYEF